MKDRITEVVFMELCEDINLFDDEQLRKEFDDICDSLLVGGRASVDSDIFLEYIFKLQKRAFSIGFDTALKMIVEL